jgi:hypothetical protein
MFCASHHAVGFAAGEKPQQREQAEAEADFRSRADGNEMEKPPSGAIRLPLD